MLPIQSGAVLLAAGTAYLTERISRPAHAVTHAAAHPLPDTLAVRRGAAAGPRRALTLPTPGATARRIAHPGVRAAPWQAAVWTAGAMLVGAAVGCAPHMLTIAAATGVFLGLFGAFCDQVFAIDQRAARP